MHNRYHDKSETRKGPVRPSPKFTLVERCSPRRSARLHAHEKSRNRLAGAEVSDARKSKMLRSICLLVFVVGCGSDSTTNSSPVPTWPAQWTANLTWFDVDSSGAKTNVWTGNTSYDWTLKAMRTDVSPPTSGAMPGPPIGEAGTMLMRDGKMYFVKASGGCTVMSPLGAPVPDWLTGTSRLTEATTDAELWSANLDHLEPGVGGCFTYVRGKQDHVPRLFGGSASCSDWPSGSFIEYSSFTEQPPMADVFALPRGCTAEAVDPGHACLTCHDPGAVP